MRMHNSTNCPQQRKTVAMNRTRTECAQRPFLPATVTARSLADYPLASAQSRAAARAVVAARQEREAEDNWDKPLDRTGLAEALKAARERSHQREERAEALEPWTPVCIPPGKENTARGRLAARINEARARVARMAEEGQG